jgi:hypothetical protein
MRLFASLTFLWPRIIPAIVDSTAPADLTVTSFAKALPYSQAQQERAIVFAACRNPDAASKLRCLAQDTGGMLNVVAMDVTDAESGGPSG